VVGGMPGHVGGVGPVVVIGAVLLQDLLRPLDRRGVVLVVHRAVEAVQALAHAGRSALAGRFAGGVRVTILGLLLLRGCAGAAPAALALVALGGQGGRTAGRRGLRGGNRCAKGSGNGEGNQRGGVDGGFHGVHLVGSG